MRARVPFSFVPYAVGICMWTCVVRVQLPLVARLVLCMTTILPDNSNILYKSTTLFLFLLTFFSLPSLSHDSCLIHEVLAVACPFFKHFYAPPTQATNCYLTKLNHLLCIMWRLVGGYVMNTSCSSVGCEVCDIWIKLIITLVCHTRYQILSW